MLSKALEAHLPPIVVINKIDRPDARVPEVLNEIYDLFIDLDANEDQLDFPVLYTIAKTGLAKNEHGGRVARICGRCSKRSSNTSRPRWAIPDGILQMLIANLDYSDYLGPPGHRPRLQRHLQVRRQVSIVKLDGSFQTTKITKLYSFEGLKRVDETIGQTGDILAIAGVEGITIGETVTQRRDARAAAADPDRRADHRDGVHHQYLAVRGPRGAVGHVAESARAAGQGAADQRLDSRGGAAAPTRSR